MNLEERIREIITNSGAAYPDEATQAILTAVAESLPEYIKKISLYETLYGELPLEYKGVDTIAALKSYDDKKEFRDKFAEYLEQVAAQLGKEE